MKKMIICSMLLLVAIASLTICTDAVAEKDNNGFLKGPKTYTVLEQGDPASNYMVWVHDGNGNIEWRDQDGTVFAKFDLMPGSPERYQQYYPQGIMNVLHVGGAANATSGTWHTVNMGQTTMNGTWRD